MAVRRDEEALEGKGTEQGALPLQQRKLDNHETAFERSINSSLKNNPYPQQYGTVQIWKNATSFHCILLFLGEDTPEFFSSMMTTVSEAQEQLEKVDRQILTLLDERVSLMEELHDQSETDPRELEEEAVSFWAEEATDRGLDETDAEKIARMVVKLRKAA